jgi:hypothetical protein
MSWCFRVAGGPYSYATRSCNVRRRSSGLLPWRQSPVPDRISTDVNDATKHRPFFFVFHEKIKSILFWPIICVYIIVNWIHFLGKLLGDLPDWVFLEVDVTKFWRRPLAFPDNSGRCHCNGKRLLNNPSIAGVQFVKKLTDRIRR